MFSLSYTIFKINCRQKAFIPPNPQTLTEVYIHRNFNEDLYLIIPNQNAQENI